MAGQRVEDFVGGVLPDMAVSLDGFFGGWTSRTPGCTTGTSTAAPVAGRAMFVFVREGFGDPYELGKQAAGDRSVTIGGGADVARQFLAAGLVDEFQLPVVPKLLGEVLGVRRDGVVGPPIDRTLTKIPVDDFPVVTHPLYRVELTDPIQARQGNGRSDRVGPWVVRSTC